MSSIRKPFWSLAVCAVLFLSACLGVAEDEQIDDESYGAVVAPGDEEPAPDPEPIDPVPVCPDPSDDADPVDDGQCVANGYCCNTRTLNVSKTTQAGCTSPGAWYTDIVDCLNNSVCGESCRIN